MALSEWSWSWSYWTIGAASVLLYLFAGAVYRLYLSPLASFPGPKLAAVTLWYEFYYDVVQQGRYIWRIKEMHEKYGPVVRISPHELHVSDPDFYGTLYTGSTNARDKYGWNARQFGTSSSTFGTIAHARHRTRRAAVNPFFSRQTVLRQTPLIWSKVQRLCERIEEHRQSKEPLNLRDAFSALTIDIITQYCFNQPHGCLDHADFMPQWPRGIMEASAASHLNKQFGWLLPLLMMLPESAVEKSSPNMMSVIRLRNHLQGQIKQIFRDDANSKRGTSGLGADGTEPSAGPTIFHDLLRSNLPASEKTEGWFVDEGIGLVAAGTLTTAEYLKTTVYHIIANPAVLERLRAELVPVVSRSRATAQAPSLSELEALPYLRAVVQEGYRISYGVVGRLPRIAHEPLRCGDRVIPAGVPVSMTSIYLHDHPAVFPSPRTFDPQRWLTPESDRLARYLVNFGKGTRSCLGMNLARVEIVLTLAALFGGHSTFTLYQTDRSDVEMLHDFMTPSPKLDTKGVRVTVD